MARPKKDRASDATRFVIALDEPGGKKYLTNSGVWVRVGALARRFPTKQDAERRAIVARRLVGSNVKVEPENND